MRLLFEGVLNELKFKEGCYYNWIMLAELMKDDLLECCKVGDKPENKVLTFNS